MKCRCLVVLLCSLAVHGPAQAFGGRLFGGGGAGASTSFYQGTALAIPTFSYPVYPVCPPGGTQPLFQATPAGIPGMMSAPTAPPPIAGQAYPGSVPPGRAAPSAAPPSPSGPLSPLGSPPLAPRVTESRSDYGRPNPVVQTISEKRSSAGMWSVAFWNLTDRAVVLDVGGQFRTVERSRSLTLDLPREFTWSIVGRDRQWEKAPPTESALDIVIRR